MKKMSDRELLALISKKYGQRDTLKNDVEEQWKLNALYYRGRQNYRLHAVYDSGSNRVVKVEDIEGSPGMVVNMVQRVINDNVSLMLKNQPTITGVPANSDREEIYKAEYTSKAIEWIFQRQDMKIVMQKAVTYSNMYGTSFYKIYWDDGEGDTIEETVAIGVTEENGMMMPKLKTEKNKTGDIVIAAIAPQNVTVDANATNLKDCFWLIHHYAKNIEMLKFQYKDKFKDEGKGMLATIAEYIPFSLRKTKVQTEDPVCVVKEFYMKPCKDYPEGLYAKVAGDVVLEKTTLAYEDWPFVKLEHYYNPEEFWGETYTTHLVPISQEYNKTMDQLLKYRDEVLNAPWVISTSAGVNEEDVTSGNGIIWYSGDLPPRREHPADYPAALINIPELIESQFETVSAITKAMKGENPPGVRSSVTIQMLQEMTNQHLIPPAVRHEEALLELTRKFLRLMTTNYDDSRMIEVVGKNRAYWIEPFKRDLIITNLNIQMYSSLPQSKAAMQSFIQDSLNSGLLNPQDPKDKERAWSMLDLGSKDVFNADVMLDKEVAERENEMISQGEKYPPVRMWQKHEVHLEEHRKYLNSYELEMDAETETRIPHKDGTRVLTVAEAAWQHYSEHQEIIQQQMQQQMQMAMMMQGGKGGNVQPPNAG